MPHCAVTLFPSSQDNQHGILCARLMRGGEAFELQICMLGQQSSNLLKIILCTTVFSFSVLKNCSGTFLHTLHTPGYKTWTESLPFPKGR